MSLVYFLSLCLYVRLFVILFFLSLLLSVWFSVPFSFSLSISPSLPDSLYLRIYVYIDRFPFTYLTFLLSVRPLCLSNYLPVHHQLANLSVLDEGGAAWCGCAQRCLRQAEVWYQALTGSGAVKFSEVGQASPSSLSAAV